MCPHSCNTMTKQSGIVEVDRALVLDEIWNFCWLTSCTEHSLPCMVAPVTVPVACMSSPVCSYAQCCSEAGTFQHPFQHGVEALRALRHTTSSYYVHHECIFQAGMVAFHQLLRSISLSQVHRIFAGLLGIYLTWRRLAVEFWLGWSPCIPSVIST